MVCKIVVLKKCAAVKSKEMVSSETDEMGEAGPSVVSLGKPCGHPEPSSNESEKFLELSDNDDESDIGKQQNPYWQAKPRKGSMALLKVKIMERNMCGMTCSPSLGLTDEGGGHTSAGQVANICAGDKLVDRQHGPTNSYKASIGDSSWCLTCLVEMAWPTQKAPSSKEASQCIRWRARHMMDEHCHTPLHPPTGTASSTIALTSSCIPFNSVTTFTVPNAFSVIGT
ncbi:hypothetical protein BDN71DRAFT_1436796 [Pleurotus eryngii]|uniref:Uncharacterized protein n=1 Tax=Pleurotus eryngii TaxID=5323 RepID=A0A9P6D8D1_PLEER|nr:hypothetical protein BDN71DRAFT_1436796 [Pleurotus eryngii]